jgi:predicted heme/steroid binding protein
MADGWRVFTEDELKQYNGQHGQPAYIACNGKVYDVSKAPDWKGGMHKDLHYSGLDLTRSMRKAPHDASVFRRVPQVGILLSEPTPPPTPRPV